MGQCNSVDFGNLLSREIFFLNLAMGMWADNWPSRGIIENCAILKQFNGNDPLNVYGNFLVEVGSGGNCKVKAKRDAVEEFMKFVRSEEGKAAGVNKSSATLNLKKLLSVICNLIISQVLLDGFGKPATNLVTT